jgi:hypothetical protein
MSAAVVSDHAVSPLESITSISCGLPHLISEPISRQCFMPKLDPAYWKKLPNS